MIAVVMGYQATVKVSRLKVESSPDVFPGEPAFEEKRPPTREEAVTVSA